MKFKFILISAGFLTAAVLAFFFILPKNLQFSLATKEIEELPAGVDVIFGENFRIGESKSSELFSDHVEYIVNIQRKHRDVINQSSKFYIQKKRVNGEIVSFIRVETPDKSAERIEDGSRLEIQPRSFWDIFK
jgi:hypothetical protein